MERFVYSLSSAKDYLFLHLKPRESRRAQQIISPLGHKRAKAPIQNDPMRHECPDIPRRRGGAGIIVVEMEMAESAPRLKEERKDAS